MAALDDIVEKQIRSAVDRLNAQEGWIILDGKPVKDAAAAFLAEELGESAPLLKTLSIAQCRLTDASIPSIIRLLKQCPNLRSLDLSRNMFTAAGLKRMNTALQRHPSLQSLDVSRNPLGFQGGAWAAHLLSSAPKAMWELKIDCVGLGDLGLLPIAKALRKAPGITRVHLMGNLGNETSAREFTTWLHENPHIAVAQLAQQRETFDTILTQAFATSESRNLVVANPVDTQGNNLLTRNLKAAQKAANYLRQPPETLSYYELAAITERESAAYAQYNYGPTHTTLEQAKSRYEAYMAALPGLPAAGKGFAEAMFTPDAQGHTPLDNPRIWKEPQAVLDGLTTADASLQDALLQRRTTKGLSALESAAGALPTATLIKALNAQGIQLGKKAFLDAQQQPNALLKALIEREDISGIFTVNNWLGKSAKELRQVYDALPEDLRDGVAINTLRQSIEPQKQAGRYEKQDFPHAGRG